MLDSYLSSQILVYMCKSLCINMNPDVYMQILMYIYMNLAIDLYIRILMYKYESGCTNINLDVFMQILMYKYDYGSW